MILRLRSKSSFGRGGWRRQTTVKGICASFVEKKHMVGWAAHTWWVPRTKRRKEKKYWWTEYLGPPKQGNQEDLEKDATRRQGQQCASIGGPTWRIWSHSWRWRCDVENKSALSTAKVKKLRPTWSARTRPTGSTWHWSSMMRPRVVTGIAPFGWMMSGCGTLSRRLRMKIWRELMRRTRRKVTNGGQLSCAKWVKTIQKPSRKSSPILFMWSFVSTRFCRNPWLPGVWTSSDGPTPTPSASEDPEAHLVKEIKFTKITKTSKIITWRARVRPPGQELMFYPSIDAFHRYHIYTAFCQDPISVFSKWFLQ